MGKGVGKVDTCTRLQGPHLSQPSSVLCFSRVLLNRLNLANAMRELVAVVLVLGCGSFVEGQQFGPLSQLFSSNTSEKSSDNQASGSSGFISISDAHSFADQLRCTEFIPLGISQPSIRCCLLSVASCQRV
jgi:hypothetical protein